MRKDIGGKSSTRKAISYKVDCFNKQAFVRIDSFDICQVSDSITIPKNGQISVHFLK